MAEEYDDYGRKKNRSLKGVDGDEYAENLNNAGNDFTLPDYSGLRNRTAPGVPQAGRTNTFSQQVGTGMKAVADTREAIANPDNAPSTRLFQAGNHNAVSSSIQDEHDPANAASTRLFQGANHEVAGKTVEGQYRLDNQLTSPFFRAIRGNGKEVSSTKAVDETDKAVGNLDYDEKNPQQAHPYANGFYNGFSNAMVKGLEPTHRWSEYLNASRRPDLYTGTSPQQSAETSGNKLVEWNEQTNQQYRQNLHHETEPTAEAINRANEKYSHFLGGLAGTSFLMAVQRNLVQSGATMSMNNWSRLTNEIYRKVKERTGNEELALALGWGAMATLAEDIAPFGLASRVLPVDYQTIAEPVHRVLDSLISGHLSNGVVDTAVDEISQTSKNRKKD